MWKRENIHTIYKGKAVLIHAMKTYMGSTGTAPLILNLGSRWRWVVIFMLRLLYPRHPLNMKLGGTQDRSARFGKEKSLPLCREFFKIFTLFTKHNLPLEPWMVQSVVWSLCKLRYPANVHLRYLVKLTLKNWCTRAFHNLSCVRMTTVDCWMYTFGNACVT